MKVGRSVIAALMIIPGLLYYTWNALQPTRIVAVHRDGNFSRILVANFPSSEANKISWWNVHKNLIKEKYNIPTSDNDGMYSLSFWDFGDGYIDDPLNDHSSYLLCFDDIKAGPPCIKKKIVFTVSMNMQHQTLLTTPQGEYLLNRHGMAINLHQYPGFFGSLFREIKQLWE